MQDVLRERGILGTSILWFEADEQGAPLHPEHWRELALASVTTHDLPPTAGVPRGRARAAARTSSACWPRRTRRSSRRAQRRPGRLGGRCCRPAACCAPGAGADEVVEALHRLIARRRPRGCSCISLADAVGDRRAQNQPGTDQEYPNWRVPLTDGAGDPVLVDDLPGNALLRRLVATITG